MSLKTAGVFRPDRPSVRFGCALAFSLACAAPPAQALNTQRLDPGDIEALEAILDTLDPVIAARRERGTAGVLTWEELYGPLSPPHRRVLDDFRALRGDALGATAHYFGDASTGDPLVKVELQRFLKDGVPVPLDVQYLPARILDAYHRMMAAMQADLGKRLLVESGYRSAAYQLYLFLFYLPTHNHSIVETNRFVALPGHSEHGNPERQAIDFISEEGVNGDGQPEAFEALPEYGWLQRRAGEFGFFLSYPRDNPFHTAFEPWHWHYEAR